MFIKSRVEEMAGYRLMLLPAVMLFGVFFLYPMIKGIALSLTDWNGFSEAHFVGLANFKDFFHDPRALNDVKNTVLFALGSAPLLLVMGLAFALLLDGTWRGVGTARVMIYLPAIISPLIMGYVWYFLLQPERGLLSRIGSAWFGMETTSSWIASPNLALLVLVLINSWQYAGMTMVIFLSGLQAIPGELYEAAKMDGAGGFERFRAITLPCLFPSMKVNVVTNIIGSLSVFDIVIGLTDGGPGYATETLSIYIMRKCFGAFTGYSTAVALILFMIIVFPVALYLRFMRKKEFEI